MNIEINTISNKNAKSIIFILFSLAVVLLVIQFVVPANYIMPGEQTLPAEEMGNQSNREEFKPKEFAGTIIAVNQERNFLRIVLENESTYSVGFDAKTTIKEDEISLDKASLKPFTRATIIATKLPEGEVYQYMAESVTVLGDTELRDETFELQDTAS